MAVVMATVVAVAWNKMKKLLLMVMLFLALVGCENRKEVIEEPVVLDDYETAESYWFLLGHTADQKIEIKTNPSNYIPKSILFASSNEEVVKVSDEGIITPVGAGEAMIAVNVDDIIKSIRIEVATSKAYFPAPALEEMEGLTYIEGQLIANKTYQLPEDYDPGGLRPECQEAFDAMQKAAKEDGISLWIISGYRSYSYQEKLYAKYVAMEGQAAADTYSARAGHSEHQTGLAFDYNEISGTFQNSDAYKWVLENAQDYGFIVRYPEDGQAITGYIFEPWHLRFLGTEMAIKVKNSGLCLEDYLGITSQYAGE